MSALQEALRKKFATPQAALKALGISPSLIECPRLASDEDMLDLRPLLLALRDEGRKSPKPRNKVR